MKNNMKTIIFYARSAQARLYPLLAEQLKNYNAVYVTQNHEEYDVVKQKSADAPVYCLTDYIHDYWNNEILNRIDLRQIEEMCGVESLWKIFYADRFLPNYSTEDGVKMIKLHYLFFAEIVEKHHPSFFVNEEVALFSSYLYLKYGVSHNCQYIAFSVPRNFTNEKVLLSFDEGTHYPLMDSIYKNNNLTEDDLQKAREIIDGIVKNKTKPGYMLVTGRRPSFIRNYVRPLLGHLRSRLSHPIKDKLNYEQYFARPNDHVTYFRYLKQKKYYQRPKEDEKIILFPLHFQPEASTLVKSTDFVNQIHTIEILSKNIPADYMLYVKEHYAQLGHRCMDFYKEIQKFPNVRLIDPWIDSHDLIKKASAIVVLTSTVGWEALMYHKPLFVLGNVFYDTFKYSFKVDNIYNLSSLIKEKLSDFDSIRADFHVEFIRYFASYLKSMHDGHYILGKDNVFDDTNVRNLAKALTETISFYEHIHS